MLGEVFRDNRDNGDRTGENLSAVRFSGLYIDDCFSAGRNVSGIIDNRDGAGWDGGEAKTFQQCAIDR